MELPGGGTWPKSIPNGTQSYLTDRYFHMHSIGKDLPSEHE